MERKISGKIDTYIIDLKDALSSKIRELGTAASAAAASESNGNTTDGSASSSGTTIDQLCKQLTKFVYEYEKLKLTKEDFMKRKRVKNMVPIQQRCLAKRANGEQCTRKKKRDAITAERTQKASHAVSWTMKRMEETTPN